jgi:hypothetical protein
MASVISKVLDLRNPLSEGRNVSNTDESIHINVFSNQSKISKENVGGQ